MLFSWFRSRQPSGGFSKWHVLAGEYIADVFPLLPPTPSVRQWTWGTTKMPSRYAISACGQDLVASEVTPSMNFPGSLTDPRTGLPFVIPALSAATLAKIKHPISSQLICERCMSLATVLVVSQPA